MSSERIGANQRQGAGAQGQRVLMAIGAGGTLTLAEICEALTGQVARKAVSDVTGDLERRGFLGQTRKGGVSAWSLTVFGAATLPKPVLGLPGDWRPLQIAQKPPRRPGSDDFRGVPSVMADRKRGWRHPC